MPVSKEFGLTQMQSEVDGVRVLHPRQHGLALPPGGILLVVVVREEDRAVVIVGIPGVADMAGLGDACGSGLDAVLLWGRAARVRGHNGHVKGRVHELRHTPLSAPVLLNALVHGRARARQHAAACE